MTPFEALLSYLSLLEPKNGWHLDAIRTLTDLEISVCLDKNPDIFRAVTSRMSRLTAPAIANAMSKHSSPSERATEVGSIIRARLERECRSHLLSELVNMRVVKETENACVK